jgi:hypothetical protein
LNPTEGREGKLDNKGYKRSQREFFEQKAAKVAKVFFTIWLAVSDGGEAPSSASSDEAA